MSARNRRHGVDRALTLGLVLLMALPGTLLLAQQPMEDDLSQPVTWLGDWEKRPEYSLSLRECLALAMDHNLDIAVQGFERGISGNRIDTAKSALESVLNSTFTESEVNSQNADPFSGLPVFFRKTRGFNSTWNDPTVWGGTFTATFQGAKQITTPGQSLLIPLYFTSLDLTYRQDLLRKFGLEVNRAPITIARNNTRVTESQFRDTVMVTLESAESAYWELVFARRDLEVKKRSLDLAQELLRINKAKVDVGTLAPIDVTQAEAGVASRAEDLIVSVGNLLTQEDALRQLLNPPRDNAIWTSTLVPSDHPTVTSDKIDTQEALEIARQNRPDLEQQRLTIESNALQEKVDRKAKRWDLYVEGSYSLEGLEGRINPICDDPNNPTPDTCVDLNNDGVGDVSPVQDTDFVDAIHGLDETEFGDWRVQAGLTIPIGNRALKAQYANSKLRHEQSKIELEKRLLAAEIDVTQKVRDITVNRQRVRAAQKNRELQEKNVEAERKKYENGMSTSFQVLQIQEDLSTAESQENRAKVDFQKSLTALERAKGTLLEARNIQVASVDFSGPRSSGGSR